MKLTNAVIEKMVDGLLSPIYKRKKDILSEISAIVQAEIEALYPPEVQALYKAGSKYLRRENYIRIQVLGTHKDIRLSQDVATDDRSLYVIKGSKGQKIIDLYNEREELTQKSRRLDSELSATLKTLGSDIRVRKEFPEAAQFLPAEGSKNIPALNLEKIRLDLKALTE